ncbi:ArsR/SmtB family transcription factor [Paractinoplanes toevensis]|uniref:Transcriptional regulator n=1 Tax=Paractinoplanes toevensis TaxID=571911 RepID=A0A919TAF6_9ACTN|nr:DUF5937 family protein [Actinoplanes toevensis]GIM91452.1 transcriptional regulator [Actinoplanes toevensis]
MATIGLSATSATRIRFAVSCLWEVLASVRILRDPGVPPIFRTWSRRARLSSETLLWHLIAPTGGYTPDFLTPPPSGLSADLRRELTGLRATPAALVREHLDLLGADRPRPLRKLHADPVTGLARLAAEIESYWQVAIAPDWPRMRALLEAEVHRQARRVAESGSTAVLNDLHPQVTWHDGGLTIDQPHCTAPDVPDGTGVVLIPSVFVWPSVLTVTAGEVPQLAYPAHGVATLWEQSSRSPEPLVALLGRGRAALLRELGTPRSTTELAGRTGMTAGGVSQHLSTLRAAGLVVTHRQGRSLLNTRTEIAEALLAASQSGSTTGVGVPATQVTVVR